MLNKIDKKMLDFNPATTEELDAHKNSSSIHTTQAEKDKLAGIEAQANKYVHPTNHPASIITQDANNRFVTDADKTNWNGKADASKVGDIAQLTSTDKSNTVAAINEALVKMGVLSNLNTTQKASLVGSINELVNSLKSVTDNSSGADYVKATPIAGSPNTVQGILEWLKSEIDGVSSGAVPDGSITGAKIAPSTITQDKLAFQIASDATSVSVVDVGSYYTSNNAEGALQEIGQTLNSVRGSLITSANNLLGT